MREHETYKQMVYSIFSICGLAILLILLFIYREKLSFVFFASGSLVLIGIMFDVILKFLGITRENAKAFVVIAPIYYVAFFVLMISAIKETKSLLVLFLLLSIVILSREEIPKWKEAIRCLMGR